ncbi:MAG: SRPBCC domain-containing protein [Candidatus Hydrogenedentes bacterium]|nr:SRPBCC domain-containing protein [Candidatus Hydrogenedentota bacterium]
MDPKTDSPDGLEVLKAQRTVSFTPEEVYAAFSDPSRLAKWWGPKDFTNTFETFEFKPGGQWVFVMHGPDGSDYQNESEFVELEPGKKVVVRHVCQPHFMLTVSLVPCDAGTQVLWVQEFGNPGVAAAIRCMAGPGNEQNLERLNLHLLGELQ